MNTRYIEFDSTYRDRNQYPLASSFVMPISQTGRKDKFNALDPVSLQEPIFSWTSNYLDINSTTNPPNKPSISGDVSASSTIQNTTDYNTIVLFADIGSKFQQLTDYYSGLVIEFTNSTTIYKRILNSTYLGVNGDRDTMEIILSSYVSDSFSLLGSTWIIKDPTDVTSSISQFFIPRGRLGDNAYYNYYIYNETKLQGTKVLNYDGITRILSANYVSGWSNTDNFCIRKELPYISAKTTIVSTGTVVSPGTGTVATSNNVIVTDQTNPASLSTNYDNYKNMFLRVLLPSYTYSSTNTYGSLLSNFYDASKITIYSGDGIIKGYNNIENYTSPYTFTIYPPFSGDYNNYIGLPVEILDFSYDNLNPFVYTGSLESQQQMVCYKIELLNLILPNSILKCGEGGRIAFYPYIYVTLSNVSASSAGLKNIIYSNNPNSTKVIFRVPIDDIVNPLISTFIKVDGDGMVQTIKFYPNDNLYFSVTLPNGEFFETILQEYYSPHTPNPAAQISASFAIERI